MPSTIDGTYSQSKDQKQLYSSDTFKNTTHCRNREHITLKSVEKDNLTENILFLVIVKINFCLAQNA
jgi:hypothetical protein